MRLVGSAGPSVLLVLLLLSFDERGVVFEVAETAFISIRALTIPKHEDARFASSGSMITAGVHFLTTWGLGDWIRCQGFWLLV
jgi:hypothetical protein